MSPSGRTPSKTWRSAAKQLLFNLPLTSVYNMMLLMISFDNVSYRLYVESLIKHAENRRSTCRRQGTPEALQQDRTPAVLVSGRKSVPSPADPKKEFVSKTKLDQNLELGRFQKKFTEELSIASRLQEFTSTR